MKKLGLALLPPCTPRATAAEHFPPPDRAGGWSPTTTAAQDRESASR